MIVLLTVHAAVVVLLTPDLAVSNNYGRFGGLYDMYF